MATKAIVRLAKEFVIKVNDMVIARCTDFSLSLGKNTVDITSFDSEGFEEYIADTKNWNISFGSMVTREHGAGTSVGTGYGSGVFLNLFDHWASASSDYPVVVGIGDSGTAQEFFSGYGILTELSVDGSVGDKITYSGTIQGSGKLSRG
jgi:predicted secreted protein